MQHIPVSSWVQMILNIEWSMQNSSLHSMHLCLFFSKWLQIGDYDPSTGTFHFSKGGFQGARGNNNGDNFYIENVFEELDAPGEFYFDAVKKMLYLW